MERNSYEKRWQFVSRSTGVRTWRAVAHSSECGAIFRPLAYTQSSISLRRRRCTVRFFADTIPASSAGSINLDVDKFVKHTQEVLGVPAKIMKSEAEVAELREERAAQQQAMMEQQQQLEQAKAAGQEYAGRMTARSQYFAAAGSLLSDANKFGVI